mmetsp:Transcript_20516/g.44312  ORF Transcript_20516/g.44312 Transcript_20516/m.44312 type:complete len:535 (-) Transcript_20516:320-1924(-)
MTPPLGIGTENTPPPENGSQASAARSIPTKEQAVKHSGSSDKASDTGTEISAIRPSAGSTRAGPGVQQTGVLASAAATSTPHPMLEMRQGKFDGYSDQALNSAATSTSVAPTSSIAGTQREDTGIQHQEAKSVAVAATSTTSTPTSLSSNDDGHSSEIIATLFPLKSTITALVTTRLGRLLEPADVQKIVDAVHTLEMIGAEPEAEKSVQPVQPDGQVKEFEQLKQELQKTSALLEATETELDRSKADNLDLQKQLAAERLLRLSGNGTTPQGHEQQLILSQNIAALTAQLQLIAPSRLIPAPERVEVGVQACFSDATDLVKVRDHNFYRLEMAVAVEAHVLSAIRAEFLTVWRKYVDAGGSEAGNRQEMVDEIRRGHAAMRGDSEVSYEQAPEGGSGSDEDEDEDEDDSVDSSGSDVSTSEDYTNKSGVSVGGSDSDLSTSKDEDEDQEEGEEKSALAKAEDEDEEEVKMSALEMADYAFLSSVYASLTAREAELKWVNALRAAEQAELHAVKEELKRRDAADRWERSQLTAA